jgi:hypothetical protein
MYLIDRYPGAEREHAKAGHSMTGSESISLIQHLPAITLVQIAIRELMPKKAEPLIRCHRVSNRFQRKRISHDSSL